MTLPDDDLIVEIPSDTIQLGHDPDGLPRTEPKELPKDKDGAPDISLKETPTKAELDAKKAEDELVAALKRDREDAIRERDAEKAARAQAEADRQAALERASKSEETAGIRTEQGMRAHWRAINADHAQLVSAIGATQSEAANAERDYVAASEAGDHARAAQAQRTMAKAEALLIQLENGKAGAEAEIADVRAKFSAHSAEPKETKPEPKVEVKADPKPQTPDDWIDGVKTVVGTEGADWLKEHKEYVTDAKLNKKLLRFADEYADDHGQHALKSKAFRDALNEKFFPESEEIEVAEDEPEVVAEAPKPKAKAKTTAAAPVSRGNSFFSSSNLDAAKVRLPPKLAAFVRASGLDPTKYAIGAVEDIKAGKLPKNFLDADYDHQF